MSVGYAVYWKIAYQQQFLLTFDYFTSFIVFFCQQILLINDSSLLLSAKTNWIAFESFILY